mgnify:FL=1
MLDRSETVRQYIIIKFVMLNDVKAPAWSGSNALRHRDEVQQNSPVQTDRALWVPVYFLSFFSWLRSMISPKVRALNKPPALLAWRTMRAGRGLLSSVESNTM